jgi:HD-GYP domain-containing protein (c-di-GMP phosphodiesterase class II)
VKKNPHIRLSSVILALSSALDLVNWFVVNHHRQVAGLAAKIANELGCSDEEKSTIAIASALHDIGGISFNEKFNLSFEDEGITRHAVLGYHLLLHVKPFAKAAEIVRYHHTAWDSGRGARHNEQPVPRGAHILHLADRIAVLINKQDRILKQVDPIRSAVLAQKGTIFSPEVIDAFLNLAEKEFFWLDAVNPTSDFGIAGSTATWNVELDMDLLLHLSELFRMIIDFRSPTTATHSKDVAHLSEALARMAGFSHHEAERIHIAGNLHDIGKLAVPVEILEKQSALNREERYIMNEHPFHTFRILDRIGPIEDITLWAALHHECIDGTGYPFRYRYEDLPLGSRIVSIADMFSALTEDRSYRKAMGFDEALGVLQRFARESKADGMIVSLVERRLSDLRDIKLFANDQALKEFHEIRKASMAEDGMNA